ncbi:MAG TPA: hypothetical protein VMT94_02560 [Burkholderiales bacterium]|nr:hypothetical protein [Burkholderiales bacterium]
MAIAHQAQHVFDHHPMEQPREGHDQDFHSPLCAFHGAFDGLMSVVSSIPPALPVANNAIEQFSAVSAIIVPNESVIPASRGPPFASFFS